MNFIQIMGHLGADAETRFTPSGQKVTNLRVATTVRRGGKEETIWYRITLWGDRFDKMLPYLKKGSAIIVVGELGKPEIYTDREGKQQIALEVTAEFIRFSPFGRGEKTASDSNKEALQTPFTQPRTSVGVSGSANHYTAPTVDDGLPF
jgi:single-strand DNA-binding protein